LTALAERHWSGVRLEQTTLDQAGDLSLPDLLARRAEETPDARALIALNGELSFAEWELRATSTAALLAERLGDLHGERVLLWMGNDDALALTVVMQALFCERAIVVALDDRSTAVETLRIVGETDPKGLILSTTVAHNLGANGLGELGLDASLASDEPELALLVGLADGAVADDVVAFRPSDPGPDGGQASRATAHDEAIIFFSSGSTGAPKGAVWTHGDLCQYVERAAHAIYALPRGGKWLQADDVLQSPIPVYTAASVMENPYAGVLAGCVVAYETRRFDAVASEQRMHTFGTTIYNGAPPHFAMMCDLPPGPQPERLEMMVSGGSAFTPPLYRRMRERWPTVSMANWYGLMESGCGQTLNYGDDIVREPGAIGRPVPPTEVRVVDDSFADVPAGTEGELWTRATAQMREYFRNPEQTAKRLHDGWLRTGDRAVQDPSGLLHVVGRNEERINRGGFKFYPVEIESVLEEDPSVREAAVIAIPHEVLGQDAVAFVVPAAGEDIDGDQLRARCKQRVAPNKVPTQIIVTDALPRGAYGKVVRRDLARRYQQFQSGD
jgi:acyl-CoA synthetase (AMP-forming)/AMP-acid ligase II